VTSLSKMPQAVANGVAEGSGVSLERVVIPINGVNLLGDLVLPLGARSFVLLADGSWSSRTSRANLVVAEAFHRAGIGTLLFDLLTPTEENKDARTGYWRFDIELLTHRLLRATKWTTEQPATRELATGYYGAGTGAAAALVAAAQLGDGIRAVISRSGRPDFAGEALGRVRAPTLLIVGENDRGTLSLNQEAFDRLVCAKELTIVPGAGHLFEEAGTLDRVADLAVGWFKTHMGSPVRQ
jgi:putative phosphoribosyl transferase